MIRVNNLHIPLNYDDSLLRKKLCRELRIENSAIKNVSMFRRMLSKSSRITMRFPYGKARYLPLLSAWDLRDFLRR